MSISQVVTEKVVAGSGSIGAAATITAASSLSISEAIPTPSTDMLITMSLDVSAVKLFVAYCDQAVTLETNDGTTPTNTIALTGGIPYIWRVGHADSFKLTGDVTALYVTNASGVAATLQIEALFDSTP